MKTHKQYVSDLRTRNPGLRVVGTYNRSFVKIDHQCKSCKKIWKMTPDNALSGYGCAKCKGFKHTKYTKSEIQSKLHAATKGKTKLTSQYKGMAQKHRFQCTKHHTSFVNWVPATLKGMGCPKCKSEHISSANNWQRGFDQRIKSLFGGYIRRISPYTNQTSTVTLTCRKSHTFSRKSVPPSNWKTGCPYCEPRSGIQSRSASLLFELIEKRSRLKFQYINSSGKGSEARIQNYKLDCYNSRYNICIEYHGTYFHSWKDKRNRRYKKTMERDQELGNLTNLIVIWEFEAISNKRQVLKRVLNQIDEIKSQ